ncbi:hypothetical protein [Acetobacter aceti]|uniref:Uncharacterized protein n=1 Tax=Acetobacter aceti TaxID=435 RepID=A0A6S6PJW3_ACEAC|nr:hypothetical protein [Acetobacter aceti]BCI68128.1 hypothetical protein AAJCM20276_27520 [Acetobacter aceti]
MTPTPEMIEAAARAMCNLCCTDGWDAYPEAFHNGWRNNAEVAIKAALAAMWRPVSEYKDGTHALFANNGVPSVLASFCVPQMTHFIPLSIFEDRK